MEKKLNLTVTAGMALLFGCTEWPPHQQEIEEHFYENQEEIDGLREKLLASKYFSVRNFRDILVNAQFYEGELAEGTKIQTERPLDEDQWLDLFKDMKVDGISLDDFGSNQVSTSMIYFGGDLSEEQRWRSRFVQGPDLSLKVVACTDENPRVRCGSCVTSLVDGWWLQYWWEPYEIAPEASEAHLNGDITQQEYIDVAVEAMDACYAAGGTFLETATE